MPTGKYKRTKPVWNKGKPMGQEQKGKLSQALKGHETSIETRSKISQSLKGHSVSSEARLRMKFGNTEGVGAKAHHWKNGRYVDHRGYVLIYMPEHPRAIAKSYVWEHLLVAEKMLGHPLGKDEIVHHINGVTTDNRPENLWVYNRHTHMNIHQRQMSQIVLELYRKGVVGFKDGDYFITQ